MLSAAGAVPAQERHRLVRQPREDTRPRLQSWPCDSPARTQRQRYRQPRQVPSHSGIHNWQSHRAIIACRPMPAQPRDFRVNKIQALWFVMCPVLIGCQSTSAPMAARPDDVSAIQQVVESFQLSLSSRSLGSSRRRRPSRRSPSRGRPSARWRSPRAAHEQTPRISRCRRSAHPPVCVFEGMSRAVLRFGGAYAVPRR